MNLLKSKRAMEFVKGQSVFIKSDDSRNPDLTGFIVESIGRKYITVKNTEYEQRVKFYSDTLQRVDWGSYYLYPNKECYELSLAKKELISFVIVNFERCSHRFSLQELEQIKELIALKLNI